VSEQAAPEELVDAPGFEWLSGIPEVGLYLVMAGAAALKAFVPPLPADTVVFVSAILVGQGTGSVAIALVLTSLGGVGGALLAYALFRRYGRWLVRLPGLRRLVRPGLIRKMQRYHGRAGSFALFATRFIPGLRHVVPVFAGLVALPAKAVILPIAMATAIWYGTIVAFGGFTGHQLARGLAAEEPSWVALALGLLGVVGLFVTAMIARRVIRNRLAGEPDD